MENEKPQVINDRCWIAEDGSQGQGDVVIFNEDDLNEEQWEIFNNLAESEMFEFVKSVINGEDDTFVFMSNT
jgi:hypothetical protein